MISKSQDIEWRSKCPLSSALDVLGDKWSLLIIRDLTIHGPRTYSQFLEAPEHISTNILASRLELLTCLNLIERTSPDAAPRNNAYQLTASGAALRPILEEFVKWAGTHLSNFHADMIRIG